MTVAARNRQRDPLPTNRLTSAFERRVGRALLRHVAPDAPLVVAASGGPDSTALLVASARVRAGAGVLVAACFDHGMRPAVETARDRAAVRALARTLGVSARTGATRAAAPLRGEAAARVARYRWLAGVCADVGADACATGHTLDDQAETVLLRLTRGAGLAGAAGMAEQARWPVAVAGKRRAAPRLLRPLLAVRRDDVLDYLDALDLDAREDETNSVVTFDRNRVRHRVFAELRRINPRAAEQLARFAAHARNDDEALTAWALQELGAHAAFDGTTARVARGALAALPVAISSRLLRLAAQGIGLRLERVHVEQLLALTGRRRSGVALPGGEAVTTEAWLELRALSPVQGTGVGRRGARSAQASPEVSNLMIRNEGTPLDG
jgi:tRNA(Ile)-lysidine synthase